MITFLSLEHRLDARSEKNSESYSYGGGGNRRAATDTTTDSSAANPVIAPPASISRAEPLVFDDYVNQIQSRA
jgi:hypothetical protein